ncbi:MAG TPA: isochorismatase family protein [Streptosporangiaceae bacterium]|jgi:bifunctional isochorismate lyase/aryl carrier protein|nr:isochorismatase family protein [Streptosporangiaceae bacterium]
MAIPAIAAYPMPTEADLPAAEVTWVPDPARAMLLIHDMQRYFVNAYPSGRSPATELVGNIRRLRETADDLGIPVAYTAQPGDMTRAQRGLLHDFWGPGMSTDPDSQAIIAELAPAEQDTVLTKWRYSAFHRTGLQVLLTDRGRDQLIICGIYAHIGCLMTACDAFALDVQPFFVADALADFSLAEHLMAVRYATQRCAVAITTQRLLSGLRQDHTLLPVS